ncbi:ketoacyl-ACP synthase III family protein [Nonomuraea sp. NPDC049158]|uniref:ketoacyl-ACP synthase III family protein n=1 Tax=Nonomuraea sp. NPDC049158 TaxID=3155649 RepID=UPI0033D5A018
MRCESLYVAAVASWLPPPMPVEEALARGLCDPVVAARTRAVSVTVAGEESPPEMAARAGRLAVARAGAAGRSVSLVLHARVYDQGHHLWNPASYVERAVLGNGSAAMEIGQSSNGGMAALDLAAAYLVADPARAAVLITAADTWRLPGVDRWRSDRGTVYGDGAAALVLSREAGFARLRSLALVADSSLEGMHRTGPADGPAPMYPGRTVDLDLCKRSFMARAGRSGTVARAAAGQRAAVEGALTGAGLKLDDIDWFVLPHMGHRRMVVGFAEPLGVDLERTTWPWSRSVGHLGAGDQFAGLAHLADTGRLRPGLRCLLLGVGSGFSWSAAVVEVLSEPSWAAT